MIKTVLISSCNESSTKIHPVIKYLEHKGCKFESESFVVVLGCVECSKKQSYGLDSTINAQLKLGSKMFIVFDKSEGNMEQKLLKKFSESKSIQLYFESENELYDKGLYHRSPRIFVIDKKKNIVFKKVYE